MKSNALTLPVAVMFCLFIVIPTTLSAEKKADTILIGGKLITLDAHDQIAEALAIRDGRIVAVGTSAEILKLAGNCAEVIRLDGKTVLPGFIESHVHSIGAARASVTDTYVELSSI
ncbi:MAG: hypothetical protein PHR77_17625, partial [Kiritimatiellae bacterium]|nr:hypothetical protein [Kiritimatiellia bacterium]